MKRVVILIIFYVFALGASAQTTLQKLQKAFQQFENDSQLKHAISSLYVVNARNGQVVFDKNSRIGLAPASTQKIITSITAFELLGKDYRYKTELGYDGKIKDGLLDGSLYITGSGDPTLGSQRWEQTKPAAVLNKWVNEVKKLKINHLANSVNTNLSKFSYKAIPNGWIWHDIGNYYGAPSFPLNWKENYYEIKLASGKKVGDKVEILNDSNFAVHFINELKSAPKGTGDNAYIYYDNLLAGTIPVEEKSFSIFGAEHNPVSDLLSDFTVALMADSIQCKTCSSNYSREFFDRDSAHLQAITKFYTHYSPTLDSIVYWFLKKSINLYGEALLKTIAYETKGFGSTESGIAVIKDFWKQKGMDENELNIYDGCGLSPVNRVTTHAQVTLLKYAKTKDWFPYFFDALPEYNGMKMKSGTIGGVKGFCGYQKAADGKEYIFSFLVNNYNGQTSALVNKMYKVLDQLK